MEVGALPGMTDFQPRWDWFPRAQRDPRLNPSVNCFTHTYFDSALAAAREQQKHNGEGANPHHPHFALFGVWVGLIGHRGFLLGAPDLSAKTPLPGYSRAFNIGNSRARATVICNTYPAGLPGCRPVQCVAVRLPDM
jgi:hypothetical protein